MKSTKSVRQTMSLGEVRISTYFYIWKNCPPHTGPLISIRRKKHATQSGEAKSGMYDCESDNAARSHPCAHYTRPPQFLVP